MFRFILDCFTTAFPSHSIRCPVPFLQNTFLETLLGVALHAAQLEHRDANASVMKFLTELIRCGSAEPDKIGENEAEGERERETDTQ